MKAVAYVRVSTEDQRTAVQCSAVTRYARARGWRLLRVYEDHGLSGATARRPALTRLLEDAHRRRFAVVIVWKFDRFSRSVADLLASLETFRALGIEFISVTEGIDTSTAAGRMVFTFLGAIAEFERALIRERVRAGVRATMQRQGGRWGRPRALSVRQLAQAKALRAQGHPLRTVARLLGVSRTTLRRAVAPARAPVRQAS